MVLTFIDLGSPPLDRPGRAASRAMWTECAPSQTDRIDPAISAPRVGHFCLLVRRRVCLGLLVAPGFGTWSPETSGGQVAALAARTRKVIWLGNSPADKEEGRRGFHKWIPTMVRTATAVVVLLVQHLLRKDDC